MKQEKIWEHFQSEDVVGSFVNNKNRLNVLANMVKKGEKKILNIGVGNGLLESLLKSRGYEVFSLDPSERAIISLRKKLSLSKSSAKVGYSQDIPFADGSFDVVFMSEVIEHLDDEVLEKTLLEVIRVLKPTGRYLGTVPADENLKENDALCPKCGHLFHRWGHVQSFSKNKLMKVLGPNFNDVTIKRVYFGNMETLNWKGRILWVTKKIMVSIGVLGSNENYLFACSKINNK